MSPGSLSREAARGIISAISPYSVSTAPHVPSLIVIGGSVKFSSGNTRPLPSSRPNPHRTGRGETPNEKFPLSPI